MNQPLDITHWSCAPSPIQPVQITVIQAHELNIIPPFDIVVLQSRSDASQLITLRTLKYTNARVRSFVNELLFNYNFTWTLLITGANRVSPSARNYSGYNCTACLWDMLIFSGMAISQLPQRLRGRGPPALSGLLLESGWSERDGSKCLKKIIQKHNRIHTNVYSICWSDCSDVYL